MRVSRQRIRTARPIKGIIGSYALVMAIFAAFLLGLFLLSSAELFFLS